MEWLQNSGIVAFVIFVLNIVFYAGMYFMKLKYLVDAKEVHNMINLEKEKTITYIDKRLEDHCPFADKVKELSDDNLSKFINRHIELHPILQKYNVTQYRIEQLEPDVKQIKNDIQTIKLALAKLEEK